MDAPQRHLTLDDFIVEMNREPASELAHSRFMDLAARLVLSDEIIAGRTFFANDGYARNLVCRTPAFELLVLCGRPGHKTTIHDHAGALNAIRVHSGELTSRTFRRADGAVGLAGPVARDGEERVRPTDELIGVGRDGIHQLANESGDDLVTIHIYAPPLTELCVYSTSASEVDCGPVRYTLADDLA